MLTVTPMQVAGRSSAGVQTTLIAVICGSSSCILASTSAWLAGGVADHRIAGARAGGFVGRVPGEEHAGEVQDPQRNVRKISSTSANSTAVAPDCLIHGVRFMERWRPSWWLRMVARMSENVTALPEMNGRRARWRTCGWNV